jgi:Lrp/AsnC family transcriptional regulator
MLDLQDRKILMLLQDDADRPTTAIAEEVNLSQSACSRRIAALKDAGYIDGSSARLNRRRLNLPTTIFLLVRTSQHAETWLRKFQSAVNAIPEIVEVHRLTGNCDYILKVVLPNVEHYDVIYKRLIRQVDMFEMSAYISMETVKLSNGLPLDHI